MTPELPDWYRKKRGEVEELFKAIRNEQVRDRSEDKRILSPSGTYALEITQYKTHPTGATWNYSNGVVTRVRDGTIVADIKRNYPGFPNAWVRQGNREFLICGEDYQGYCVIALDDEMTYVYIPDEAERGVGFCWAQIQPSPGGKYLLVDGCYWARDFELRLYDFSKPTELPMPLLGKLDYLYGDPYKDSISLEGTWLDDERVKIEATVQTSEANKSTQSEDVLYVRELVSRRIGL